MILLVYSCFFLSGMTGLIFEVLWTRQLTREMGGAPFAVSVVLTVFMAGLGLGAFAGGRLADRLSARGGRSLLIAYAIAEAAAALLALLVPVCLRLWQGPLSWAYARYQGGFLPFQTVVLAAAVMALLPPTLAMGMSLPLLTRLCARARARLGRHLGGLYAGNTLGAALGALLAGFLLIPKLGLPSTLGIGVALNLAIALVCLLAARKGGASLAVDPADTPREPSAPAALRTAEARPEGAAETWLPRAALALLMLSGFCAMAYEVLWTKLLALIFGPTTYAFTIVLAAFISGLALGAWVFGRWADRVPKPFEWLLALQGLAALSALAVSQRMGNSVIFFQKADFHFHDRFAMLMTVKAAFVFLLLLLPTFLLGGALPLAAKLWSRRRQLGAAVGESYLWNTAGAVLGSWCAGFLLLPGLGKESSLKLLAGVQAVAVLAGLAVALGFRPAPVSTRAARKASLKTKSAVGLARGRGVIYAAAAASATALLLTFAWPRWNRESLARINSANLNPALASLSWFTAALFPPPEAPVPGGLEYFGDGLEGFTAVWKESDIVGNAQLSLFLSGKADASSRNDMFTQTLLAHFPMAVHPRPEDVMVLGLASGTTAGEVLHYPVKRLDILEINPKVVEAARRFAPWNNGVLEDPRARIIVQDAKAHLLLSGRRYDVIISEPSNPWMAGLSELFTREFYARARSSLKPGGVFVQFIHSYKMDWETLCLVGRTFHGEFPGGILVRTLPDDRPVPGMSGDYLLVGWSGGAPWSVVDDRQKRLQAAASTNVEISDPRILYRLVVAENLGEVFGTGPIHTDDHPLLEFQAPRLMFTFEGKRIEAEIAARGRLSPRTLAAVAAQKADPAARLAFAAYALSLNMPFAGMADLAGASPDQRQSHIRRVEDYCGRGLVGNFSPFTEDVDILQHCSMRQMGILEQTLKSASSPAGIYMEMANVWMVNGAFQNAYKLLRAAAEAAPGTPLAEFAREQAARIQADYGQPRGP